MEEKNYSSHNEARGIKGKLLKYQGSDKWWRTTHWSRNWNRGLQKNMHLIGVQRLASAISFSIRYLGSFSCRTAHFFVILPLQIRLKTNSRTTAVCQHFSLLFPYLPLLGGLGRGRRFLRSGQGENFARPESKFLVPCVPIPSFLLTVQRYENFKWETNKNAIIRLFCPYFSP